MIIRKAELRHVCGITSAFPNTGLPEIAFAGRSNVGKSSLINGLLNRKSLARTSSQPGKTQTINYYYAEGRISQKQPKTGEQLPDGQILSGTIESWKKESDALLLEKADSRELFLVDLPGYGYTRAAVEIREKWGRMIERYLQTSRELRAVLLLLDIRHAPTANDRQMYEWICTQGFSPILIATKQDKIKRSQLPKQLKLLRETVGADSRTRIIPFSAQTKEGREELWDTILDIVSEQIPGVR